jgi:hypothetical protein
MVDKVMVCVWSRTGYLDDVICHAFGEVLFVLGYFTYAFYYFTVTFYAMNEDGWRYVVFWWLGLFAWFCLVNILDEYIVTVYVSVWDI